LRICGLNVKLDWKDSEILFPFYGRFCQSKRVAPRGTPRADQLLKWLNL
jgi:hypothetical protein